MSIIFTSRFTGRMSNLLRRAGRREFVVQSSDDMAGKYLLLNASGRCIAGMGWNQRDCAEYVRERILALEDCDHEVIA